MLSGVEAGCTVMVCCIMASSGEPLVWLAIGLDCHRCIFSNSEDKSLLLCRIYGMLQGMGSGQLLRLCKQGGKQPMNTKKVIMYDVWGLHAH